MHEEEILTFISGLPIEERVTWAISNPDQGRVYVPSAQELTGGDFISFEIATSNCFGLTAWTFGLEEEVIPLQNLHKLGFQYKVDFFLSRNRKGDVPYLGREAFEHILHSHFLEGEVKDIGILALYYPETYHSFQRNPALALQHALIITGNSLVLHQRGKHYPYTIGKFDGINRVFEDKTLIFPEEGLVTKTYVLR